MSDFGAFNQDNIEYWNFMRKAEDILRYLRDIEKNFSWENRQVLNQTADLITQLINQKISDANAVTKAVQSSKPTENAIDPETNQDPDF